MKVTYIIVFAFAFQSLQTPIWGREKKDRNSRKRKCRIDEDPKVLNCSPRRSHHRPQTNKHVLTITIQDKVSSSISPAPDNTNKSRLACPDCNRLHCQYKERTLNCPGRIVLGVCGCCPQCAKQEGEECGGKDNYLGICDEHLTCRVASVPIRREALVRHELLPESADDYSILEEKGRCQKAALEETLRCEPECSFRYCSLHRSSICSARHLATIPRSCQDPCQHTSCKACFNGEVPRCKACTKDDFKCMKSFAKCVKKFRYCRNKNHCRKKRKTTNSFRCWVPECGL